MEQELTLVDGIETEKVIESIIFASTEPLPADRLQECIQREGIDQAFIKNVIGSLNSKYENHGLSFRIFKIAGGYQFATLPQYDKWLSRLFKTKADRKLSQSSLEVLAIIAYKQPITRVEIEKIRGVNADWTLRSLMEKNLVTVVGREDVPGRPLLFGTTKQFLEHFGLNAISELPRLKEIEDIIREDKEFAQTMEFDFGPSSVQQKSPDPSTEQTEPVQPNADEDIKHEHNNESQS